MVSHVIRATQEAQVGNTEKARGVIYWSIFVMTASVYICLTTSATNTFGIFHDVSYFDVSKG